MRIAALTCTLALAACRFDPAGIAATDPNAADAAATDGATTDGAAADARRADAAPGPDAAPGSKCNASDDTLRLCLTFDDTPLGLTEADGSSARNDATLGVVTTTTRATASGPEGAAGVGIGSVIHVAETTTLDLAGATTIELWVRPDVMPSGTARQGVIDNNGQWGVFLHADHSIGCTMGSATASTSALTATQWVHIACVFDGAKIRAFRNGNEDSTTNFAGPLPVIGADGTNVGQDCRTGGTAGDELLGGVDDVRVWARALTAEQICAAAGRAGC